MYDLCYRSIRAPSRVRKGAHMHKLATLYVSDRGTRPRDEIYFDTGSTKEYARTDRAYTEPPCYPN